MTEPAFFRIMTQSKFRSGAGLLVLFKMNKDRKENLKVLGLLYVIAVIAGIVL